MGRSRSRAQSHQALGSNHAAVASGSRLRKVAASYSVLIVLSVLWGLAFVAIKQATFELSPVNLALLRWFIAGACFLVLVPVIGRPKTRFERRDLPRLLVVAFSNVVGYHLSLYYAETTVSAGLAGLLISFAPVFVVMLSVLLLHERAGARVVLALLLAVFGTFVLSIGQVSLSNLSSFIGPAEVVLAAGFYAVFSVLGKALVHKYGAPPTTIWAGLLGTAMLVPLLSGSFVTQVVALSAVGWTSVLYLSVLSTVFGYLLYYTLLSRGAVSRLSVQLYLAPIVSVIGGVLLLNEEVTVFTVAGGALLLLAVALVTGAGKT
jgi:drug/metabolite transporter (DMT)-like permease